MFPSGYKEDKIYSLKPTDGSGDLTFTRASSATRVNAEGLIETASVLGSELVTNGTFTGSATGWTLGSGWTYGTNNVSYDGVAITLMSQAMSTVAGIMYKIEFDISGSTGAQLSFRFTGTSSEIIFNNLVTTDKSYTYYYTAISNNTTLTIYGQNTDLKVFTIDNVSVKEYTTSNVPRIDYTGGGCGKLLLEPQRTNAIIYSEQFNLWSSAGAAVSSVVANYSSSPEGIQNATQVNFILQGDSDFGLYKSHSITASSTYAYSIYIKGEGSNIGKVVKVKAKRNIGDAAFAIITPTLTGEWQRVNFSVTYNANNTSATFYLSSDDATSCLFYGAMGEQGSYITSYIPTLASSVTRLSDSAFKTGISSLIGQTEGVMFVESAALFNDLTIRGISISDGTLSNRITLRYNDSSNTIVVLVVENGNANSMAYTATNITEFSKIAVRYKVNDVTLWVDGIKRGTDITSQVLPTNLNRFGLDNGNGSGVFVCKSKQIQLYKTYLSDTQLATLTTL